MLRALTLAATCGVNAARSRQSYAFIEPRNDLRVCGQAVFGVGVDQRGERACSGLSVGNLRGIA